MRAWSRSGAPSTARSRTTVLGPRCACISRCKRTPAPMHPGLRGAARMPTFRLYPCQTLPRPVDGDHTHMAKQRIVRAERNQGPEALGTSLVLGIRGPTNEATRVRCRKREMARLGPRQILTEVLIYEVPLDLARSIAATGVMEMCLGDYPLPPDPSHAAAFRDLIAYLAGRESLHSLNQTSAGHRDVWYERGQRYLVDHGTDEEPEVQYGCIQCSRWLPRSHVTRAPAVGAPDEEIQFIRRACSTTSKDPRGRRR
jgi:hypothetical protein